MDEVQCADWDQDQALVPVTSTANSTGNIPNQPQQEYCTIVCGFAIIFPWQEILKKWNYFKRFSDGGNVSFLQEVHNSFCVTLCGMFNEWHML